MLGSLVDFAHALLMMAWVAGLPLLFWRKHPQLTAWYAVYAVAFIIAYQASRVVFGACFLTALAQWLWEKGGAPLASPADEWFTVRVSTAIFRMAPSHRAINLVAQALILITAMGLLVARSGRRGARDERRMS